MNPPLHNREIRPDVAPAAGELGSLASRVPTLVLLLATAFAIYLCYCLALPFLSPLTWALALAVLFTPFQRWLERKLHRPSLAAAISVLVVGLVVAVPATFVVQQLIQEAAKGAEIIKAKVESGEWRRALEAQPRLAPIADWIERKVDLPGSVSRQSGTSRKPSGSTGCAIRRSISASEPPHARPGDT